MDKQAIISAYTDGKSSMQVAQLFCCSHRTVLNILRQNSIPARTLKEARALQTHHKQKKLSHEQEQEVTRLYQSGFSSCEIKNLKQISITMVFDILQRNNIPKRSLKESRQLAAKKYGEKISKASSENIRQLMKSGKLNHSFSNTKPERDFTNWCIANSMEYIAQFQINGKGHYYDFYLPTQNLIVEIDGDYWHSLIEQIERDVQHNQLAQANRYNLIRFKQSEIDATDSGCFDRIL